MEDLLRLVDIIHQRKQKQYPLLDIKNVNKPATLESFFYHQLKKGKIETDEDAAKELYDSVSDDDRYRMLKSRLKQKLLNHLFFLDFTDNNQRSSLSFEQECLDYLHHARILSFVDEPKIARSLVMKALVQAQRCEFTGQIIACYEAMLRIYSESCQPHLFAETQEKLTEARQLFAIEDSARTKFYQTRMMLVKSVNSRKQNIDLAEGIIVQLEALWDSTKSYNIFNYLLQLILLVRELKGEFLNIIPLLREIETGQFRGSMLNVYRLDQQSIILSLSFAYFRGKQYDAGLAYIEKHQELFDKSSVAWGRLQETHLLITIQKGDYALATMVFQDVQQSDFFKTLSAGDRAKWKLYEGYLQLMKTGTMRFPKALAGLLTAPLETSDDAEGYNMALLVIQFVHGIEMKRHEELKNICKILRGYMDNHFKENFSYRSRTFYKLMNIVVEYKLDPDTVLMKSRYLTKKLKEAQIVGTVHQEYEIVPYEALWDLIIQILKGDF